MNFPRLHSQVLLKDAHLAPPRSWIFMSSFSVASVSKAYDWTDNSWKSVSGGNSDTFSSIEVTAGRAVSERMELFITVPWLVHWIQDERLLKAGLGDIILSSRFGFLKNSPSDHALTGLLAVRSPAGSSSIDPFFGDGTWDIGAGLLWASPPDQSVCFHLKTSYWMNGSTERNPRPADDFIFIVSVETAIHSKIKSFVRYHYSLIGTIPDGEESGKSQATLRHYLITGISWKPWSAVNLRPSVKIPLGGRGGTLLTINPTIDFLYILRRRLKSEEKQSGEPGPSSGKEFPL